MEMYISNSDLEVSKVLRILKENRVLCNVIPLYSVVFNKKAKKTEIEKGCKVDIFSITDNDLFKVYLQLKTELGITCIWINKDKYSGCICEYKPFINYEKSNNIALVTCSEY